MYLAFLAVSCVGFSSLAAREFIALGTKDRMSAVSAIKESLTMLDLHKAEGPKTDASSVLETSTKSGKGRGKGRGKGEGRERGDAAEAAAEDASAPRPTLSTLSPRM